MTDLSWVQSTEHVPQSETSEYFDDPNWHLLLVTGGLHTPIEYVFGRGDRPTDSGETQRDDG